MKRLVSIVLLAIGCLTLVIPVLVLVVSVFLVPAAPIYDKKKKYNAILVLGNPTNEDGSPSSILMSRIVRAVELYNNGAADYIVMTGGAASNHHVEAEVMKKEAVLLGVDEFHVIMEPRSRFTVENAKYCKDIIDKKNWQEVIVITSTYHAQRSHFIFSKFGFNYSFFPVEFPRDISFWQKAMLYSWDKFLLVKYYMFGDENFPA